MLQFAIDAVRAEAFNPKTLFLFGSYTIGKERLFLGGWLREGRGVEGRGDREGEGTAPRGRGARLLAAHPSTLLTPPHAPAHRGRTRAAAQGLRLHHQAQGEEEGRGGRVLRGAGAGFACT